MRNWRRTLSRRMSEFGESGQALAEIAIALPLLLLMLIGIWEFARAYQIQQVVVNAAREGARIVVLPDSSSAAGIARAESFLAGGSVPCSGCVSVSPAEPHDTGIPVTVQVSVPYSFNLIGPMIRLATGNSGGPGDITLSSQSTMRHE